MARRVRETAEYPRAKRRGEGSPHTARCVSAIWHSGSKSKTGQFSLGAFSFEQCVSRCSWLLLAPGLQPLLREGDGRQKVRVMSWVLDK